MKEAGAVFERAQREVLRERLAQIGKRRSSPQGDVPPHASPRHEQRDVLTRMIGARRRRIVPVIGRDDQQIGRQQSR